MHLLTLMMNFDAFLTSYYPITPECRWYFLAHGVVL